jgi:glycosyltransferase involved in cell wall biosynthesis
VDASATVRNRTGAENYVMFLVRALAAHDRANEYVIFAPPDTIADFAIDQRNVTFVPVPVSGRSQRMLWQQLRLPGAVRKVRADVLHAPHYIMPFGLGIPCVVTFCDMTHELFPEVHQRVRRVLLRAIKRSSARRAARLIAISESARRDVIRVLGVDPGRVASTLLAGNPAFRPAPPASVATACEQHGVRPGAYVLTVGTLEPRKNLGTLIEAYAAVEASFPETRLLIVGKAGWMYDGVFAQAERLRREGRVAFTGYVSEEELVALYTGARVFVYPSLYEGFGLPVVEAMQCGAPVITTDVSSMPEVAGDAARLVAPRDVGGFARAIGEVLTDDALAGDLARRGRERAASFSWERCAEETLRVYRAALA